MCPKLGVSLYIDSFLIVADEKMRESVPRSSEICVPLYLSLIHLKRLYIRSILYTVSPLHEVLLNYQAKSLNQSGAPVYSAQHRL